MGYRKTLLLVLVVYNVHLSSSIIHRCNQTVDCGCSKTNVHISKIVGGEDAFPYSWGWAVSLQFLFGGHFCTGTIVSPLHIITAAHCVTSIDFTEVTKIVTGINRLSDSDNAGVQQRSINRVYSHPEYNKSSQLHDIAVLRLNESLDISSESLLARLCIPRIESVSKNATYPGDSASLVAIGWGRLKHGNEPIPDDLHLQQVTVKAISVHDERCTEFITNSNTQFCAGVDGGGKDTCQGDSGGPLMRYEPKQQRWILAGITSFGMGCADPRYSGVYTRVSAYRDWLRSIISDGFIEAVGETYSTATKNFCKIYIAFVLIIQLFFLISFN